MKKPSSPPRRKQAAKPKHAARPPSRLVEIVKPKQAVPRTIEPAWISPPDHHPPAVHRAGVEMRAGMVLTEDHAPEVVLVAVPVEKTKTTMWQQFVDWLRN